MAPLFTAWCAAEPGPYEPKLFVMRGLDPRIHLPSEDSFEEDGWPGQARPWRLGVWYGPGSAQRHEECRNASGTRSTVIRPADASPYTDARRRTCPTSSPASARNAASGRCRS